MTGELGADGPDRSDDRYGDPMPVTVVFVSNPLPGKKSNVGQLDPPVCTPCTVKRWVITQRYANG